MLIDANVGLVGEYAGGAIDPEPGRCDILIRKVQSRDSVNVAEE